MGNHTVSTRAIRSVVRVTPLARASCTSDSVSDCARVTVDHLADDSVKSTLSGGRNGVDFQRRKARTGLANPKPQASLR